MCGAEAAVGAAAAAAGLASASRRCGRRRWRGQAPPQELASPGLSGGPVKPPHGATGRGPPRFALPREPASPAGDEAGKRLRGAQHKGLSPGATAAAAATAPTSLEPPVEAEPAPGPSSPPVPSGGHCPCPRGPGTRAPSPLLPRLPGDQTAAQPPPLQTVGALRSMSEDSDMEKAIKVIEMPPTSSLLCPVFSPQRQPRKIQRTWTRVSGLSL